MMMSGFGLNGVFSLVDIKIRRVSIAAYASLSIATCRVSIVPYVHGRQVSASSVIDLIVGHRSSLQSTKD